MDTALVGCPTGSGIQDLYRNTLQSDAGEEATAAIDFGNSISNSIDRGLPAFSNDWQTSKECTSIFAKAGRKGRQLTPSKLCAPRYCGGVPLPVGGGVGGGLPFGFADCCPVVPGAVDPDGAVP